VAEREDRREGERHDEYRDRVREERLFQLLGELVNAVRDVRFNVQRVALAAEAIAAQGDERKLVAEAVRKLHNVNDAVERAIAARLPGGHPHTHATPGDCNAMTITEALLAEVARATTNKDNLIAFLSALPSGTTISDAITALKGVNDAEAAALEAAMAANVIPPTPTP